MIVFPEIFYRGTSFLNSHHWIPAQKRCGNDRMGDYRVFTSVRFNWLKIVANLVDLCRQKGIDRAIETYFDKKDAAIWKQRLFEDGYTEWYDPHKIWGGIDHSPFDKLRANGLR